MHLPRLERFAREFPIQNLENPPFCKVPKQAYRTQFPLGAFDLTMPSRLTGNAANDMQRGPIGPLCISSCRAINGLLLLRHAGLECDRR